MLFIRNFVFQFSSQYLLIIIILTIPFIVTAGNTSTLQPDNSATFPRHPSVSPDGSKIAFSWEGDIWSVKIDGGRALRLTATDEYEHHPEWSPDSHWIAYNSDPHGDDDVFIIPAQGGTFKRLTWFDKGDYISGWTPDSKNILFSSHRDDFYPDYRTIYRVPINGGTPLALMDALGSEAVMSHDGSQILYVRGGVHWWRKHYRGSKSAQIWKYDIESRKHIAITDTLGKENGDDFRTPSYTDPMWHPNGDIYLRSDRDGTFNLWKLDTRDNWHQLTDYKDDGLRFPSMSHDGSVIAWEQGLDIYVMKNEGTPQKLVIIAPLTQPADQIVRKTYTRDAQKAAFTPDEKNIIFEVRGEIFAGRIVDEEIAYARGKASCLTGNIPARDGGFALSPDGEKLVYVSDKEGNKNLYLIEKDKNEEWARAKNLSIKQLTDTPDDDHYPQWSPDGKIISFVRGKGDLYLYKLEKEEEQVLFKWWSMGRYQWSPDSKWIAWAREDDEYNSDVFITPVNEYQPVNISRHPDQDDFPVWSRDGRLLAFRSKREHDNHDIYYVLLSLENHQKSWRDWDEEKYMESLEKKSDKKDDNDDEEKEAFTVEIDTTDIYRRLRQVTHLPSNIGQFDVTPDGETFVFESDHEDNRDIYSITWRGKDIDRLTKGGENPKWLQITKKGKTVRFLDSRGNIQSVKVSGGKKESYPFEAVLAINPLQERYQKFGETWRTLNDRYYHPDFHGCDWDAMYDKYRPMISSVSCEEDFADIMRMMIGELNSSHSGYSIPRGGDNHWVGRLGLDFDPNDTANGLLISHVLPRGACDRKNIRLKPGDRLIAVDGVKLVQNVNLHKILDHKSDEIVELEVLHQGKSKPKTYSVQPMGSWSLGWLRYDEWVQQRRQFVHELTDGKFGYLHIRGMGQSSLERFEAQLFSVGSGRDGLVIDVRNNGGGSITDYLLAMLQVKRHAVTYPRDGGPGYPQGRLPLYAWTKPIIVLCNEHSFSNAEIFSHAIKTLERGRLVGVPTPGGVISTGWEGLLDGSSFRLPLRGWYTGNVPERDPKRNMEGNGAVPHVIIEMMPDELTPQQDRQLIHAVNELILEVAGEE